MDLFLSIVQMLAMLAAVVALAYLVLNKGLGRFLVRSQLSKNMTLKERLHLEQRRCLYQVEIHGRNFVLAGSENGVSVVCELHEKPIS